MEQIAVQMKYVWVKLRKPHLHTQFCIRELIGINSANIDLNSMGGPPPPLAPWGGGGVEIPKDRNSWYEIKASRDERYNENSIE